MLQVPCRHKLPVDFRTFGNTFWLIFLLHDVKGALIHVKNTLLGSLVDSLETYSSILSISDHIKVVCN